MTNILGFTGTRQGMTNAQKNTVTAFLREHDFHTMFNGACRGADRDVFQLAKKMANLRVQFFPGDDDQYAWADKQSCTAIHLPPERKHPHLARNRTIISRCDHLLATPKEDHEVLRSGTWATIRAARRLGKPVTIIYPDGTLCT